MHAISVGLRAEVVALPVQPHPCSIHPAQTVRRTQLQGTWRQVVGRVQEIIDHHRGTWIRAATGAAARLRGNGICGIIAVVVSQEMGQLGVEKKRRGAEDVGMVELG
jgi:hypothetical protein